MRSYLVSHGKLAVLACSDSGNEQARHQETRWLVWKVTFFMSGSETTPSKRKRSNRTLNDVSSLLAQGKRRLDPCFDGHHGEVHANGR